MNLLTSLLEAILSEEGLDLDEECDS